MSSILIVDDDPHILRTLEIMLKDDGHSVHKSTSGEDAVKILEDRSIDIALIDLQLPGIGGLDVLKYIRNSQKEIDAIIITAYGSIESAVEAMKDGAFDYLTKPFSPDQVRHRLSQLATMRLLRTEIIDLQKRLGELPFKDEFITENPAVFHVLETAMQVAQSNSTVLISGESGTGKTLLARLIHTNSERKNQPFITLDCTCFQENLFESELFGHTKGAFTGAVAEKVGKAELANGGTLFLDEIGEIPIHLQGKIMRLVEEKVYERLGDPQTKSLDIRIVAASNRDLQELIQDKLFREDLYYRLSVVDLCLPPLRNRPEDILLLSRKFIARFSQAHGKDIRKLDAECEHALLSYSYPGNVRELAHALERAVLLANASTIQKQHLPPRMLEFSPSSDIRNDEQTLAELEENHIRRILGLNLPLEESARKLGIDPSTLWRKRKRYNI